MILHHHRMVILPYKVRDKMKKFLSILTLLISLPSFSVPMDASALRLKVYKMAVSTSPNCSSPVTVFETSSPSYVDFKGAPNLGNGNLADGTYPCVIIEFSDNIKLTPSANGALCSVSSEVTNDVCRCYDQNSDGDCDDVGENTTSTLIDGSTATCTSGDDRVAMYLSTASSATTQSDAFNPPGCNTVGCDNDTGFNLASPLVVAGTVVGKFVVNTDDKVCDGDDGWSGVGDCSTTGNVCSCESDTQCNMLPPLFSFEQQ
jgi:hypothetical protein